jgi:signal transduction histidine kinase
LLDYREGTWLLHPIPEIARQYGTNAPRGLEISLCPVRQGQVLILLPGELLEFRADETPQVRSLRAAAVTPLESFTSFALARDGGLWVVGKRGLLKIAAPVRSIRERKEWRELVPPAEMELQNLREFREYEDGAITFLADSRRTADKLLVQYNGQRWTPRVLGVENIRSAWRGPDKTWWAITSTALLRWDEGTETPVETEEVSAREYYDVAVEPSGAFWLATSDGLFRYAPALWRQPRALRGIESLIHGLTADREDRLWFISGNGLHSFHNEVHQEVALPASSPPALRSAATVHSLRNGLLTLESRGQLFTFDPLTSTFTPLTLPTVGGEARILGRASQGRVCIQTAHSQGATILRLSLYDGTGFEPLPEPPPEFGAAGELYTAFSAQNGDLWIGSQRGTALFRDQKWQSFLTADNTTPEEAICFVELSDGRIWCASQDKIWEFDGQNWSETRRGFDRINAFLRARDGSVWVASNSGLHRFLQNAWVGNGIEEGLPATGVRELYEDQRGRVWAGTTHGLCVYHPEADADPPRSEILDLSESDTNLFEGATLNVSFSGQDKWKHTPRERLLYSYRLDQRDWSEFSEINRVPLSDLPAGKHSLQVRTMDRNCNVDPKPASLELVVLLPWYRESRLVMIGGAGLAVALFFAVLALNRHRRLVRSYAEVELKVTQRTHELEEANRELLHSQKMTALGTLAAGIAHDFNNILSIVQGSAQIIEENLENPEKIRTRVSRIKTSVEQGAGIVRAMLGFSRGSGQNGLCDLNAIVADTIKLLGDRFQREVEITFKPEADLPPVSSSRELIQQILLNFIFNAAESTSERREVLVSTARVDRLVSELVLVPAIAENYVTVSVQDFGCGISSENLPRIFEPFFTTKAFSARRGTGLGLSMVYELAKKLQAGIAVKSVVDRGSTFTLILPVSEIPVESEPAGPERQQKQTPAPTPSLE